MRLAFAPVICTRKFKGNYCVTLFSRLIMSDVSGTLRDGRVSHTVIKYVFFQLQGSLNHLQRANNCARSLKSCNNEYDQCVILKCSVLWYFGRKQNVCSNYNKTHSKDGVRRVSAGSSGKLHRQRLNLTLEAGWNFHVEDKGFQVSRTKVGMNIGKTI